MSTGSIESTSSSWRHEHAVTADIAKRIGSTALLTCLSFDTAVESIIGQYSHSHLSLDEAQYYIENETRALEQDHNSIFTTSVRHRMQNQVLFAQKRLLLQAAEQSEGSYERLKDDLFDGTTGLAAQSLASLLAAHPSPAARASWLGALNEQTALTLLNLNGDVANEPHIALPARTSDDFIRGFDIDFYYHDHTGFHHTPISVKSGEAAARINRRDNRARANRKHIVTISGNDMQNTPPKFLTSHQLDKLHKGAPGIKPDREESLFTLSENLIDSIKYQTSAITKTAL